MQGISCFKERPSQPIRYLIARNLDQLIKIAILQTTEFQNTCQTKARGLDQLKYALLIGEDRITKHTQFILKSLVRISHTAEQIPGAVEKIKQIVQIIGFFVKPQYTIPLMVHTLGQEQFKNSTKNTVVLLNILGQMCARSEGLDAHVDLFVSALTGYEMQFTDNDEGLSAIFSIASTLLVRLHEITPRMLQVLFQIFINVQATRSLGEPLRLEAGRMLQLLAGKGGFPSVAELHASEIGPILQSIIKSREYTNWNKSSKNRFKFDTIVRNCSSEVSRFLQDILVVFQFMLSPHSDIEVRMDTLVLIEHVVGVPELREALAPLSEQLLKRVLLVAIQWKVGKPQIKIRKAGVINIINLIDRGIVSGEQLLFCFKDLVPHLKNCLSDDWAPELRLASCELLQKYLLATKQKIGDDQLKEIYPLLLQRLDDSQDPIRIKVAAAINVFFSCRYIKLSQSTFDYVIGAIFVHFDDSSEDVQSAIFANLKHAAVVDPKLVLKHARANLQRMKHKKNCGELVAYCEERIQEFTQ